MMKHIIYSILFLCLYACQSIDKPPKPKTLIGEDQMVQILTDIAFIQAAKSSNRKLLEDKKVNPESYILKKHGIDSIVFEENNIWYSGQLEKYEGIFRRVKDSLQKSRDYYEKVKKEEDSIQKIKDSIAKSKDTLDKKEDKLKIPKLELNEIEEEMEEGRQKKLTSDLSKIE